MKKMLLSLCIITLIFSCAPSKKEKQEKEEKQDSIASVETTETADDLINQLEVEIETEATADTSVTE